MKTLLLGHKLKYLTSSNKTEHGTSRSLPSYWTIIQSSRRY